MGIASFSCSGHFLRAISSRDDKTSDTPSARGLLYPYPAGFTHISCWNNAVRDLSWTV